MVLTTFQSQIHGFKPLDTTKRTVFEQFDLESEQSYFMDRVYPAYKFCAPTAKGIMLGLNTGSGNENESESDDENQKNGGEKGARFVSLYISQWMCMKGVLTSESVPLQL